jgi:hypothetical protein
VTPAPDRSISVIRLRTSLEGSVTCARELRRLSNYLPVEGSQAASELEEGAELADEWAPNPLDQALMIASVHLAAADDCMNALGVLLAKDVVYSPFVIVRSVLETAARGWHILDPDIGMRERVARGMTERLYGLSEIGRMGKQFAERARTDRVPKIIESAERQGFTPIPPRKKWEPYAIDSPRPGMMESIEALLFTMATLASGGSWLGTPQESRMARPARCTSSSRSIRIPATHSEPSEHLNSD